MRTVLFLSQTAYPVGGVQRWVDLLASVLPEQGWRVVMGLAWGAARHDPQEYRRFHADLDTLLLDGRTGSTAARLLAISDAARKVRADVLVPLALADVFTAVAEMKRDRVPIRLLYGSYEVAPRMLLDAERNRGIVDRGLGVSALTTEALISACGLPRERVDHVPPGVLPGSMTETRVDGPLRIGFAGRFDPAKRALDLVPLCQALERRDVEFEMTVVGRGEEERRLREEAAGLIARGRVRILPAMPTERLYSEFFPRLDALVFFSETAEGLPSVLLEGMAHGIVPVTSDWEGLAEEGLIRDGESGFVFPPGEIDLAAERLESLARNGVLLARLSHGARRVIESGYSLPRMAEGWARSLNASLEGPPAVGPVNEAPLGRDRLTKVLGRRTAEALRRMARSRWPHPFAEEWPFAFPASDEEIAGMVERIAVASRRLLAARESRATVPT